MLAADGRIAVAGTVDGSIMLYDLLEQQTVTKDGTTRPQQPSFSTGR